ncbi:glycosyltransferase [Nibribacter ruber]|uniref:Glycosyltransferase n=1 Tax=Nibribacter ruber TaxID=2698458 RepID=A0A6P1P3Z7_9BACT|nr:glycosyltransferase [Nibribacter ruber]QHL89101.1 glycosyltransferase [Nibribacter ruber]
MEIGVSVVICTFNGARLLPKTLRHLAQQQVREDIKWEVLIVDNASTDNSQRVIYDVWADSQTTVPLIILYQPQPGLTHARHMAMENATYDFVLFCDDDNWLAPDYVSTAYGLMTQNPSIGALGGRGELVFENKVPLWVRGHGLFANGPQAKESGSVPNNVVYGAGCVIRKTAYEKIVKAQFQPLLADRLGTHLSAGGDYELCYNLALAGYSIWYEEKLRFKHFMPNSRLSWEYTVRLIKQGAKSFESIVPYRIFLNKGARGQLTFYLCLVLIMASYALKWTRAFLSYLGCYWHKEERDFYFLKTISARAKISALFPHRALYANFQRIHVFDQHLRKVPSKQEEPMAQDAMAADFPEMYMPV